MSNRNTGSDIKTRQRRNNLYFRLVEKNKAKKMIRVPPFGIIQEIDTDKKMGQIQQEITGIFRLYIVIGMISDHQIVVKKDVQESSEDEITEEMEIEVIITEIIAPQTQIKILTATIFLMSLHGLQLHKFQQHYRIRLFLTFLKDTLVVQLPNW
ncbi:MAG: hypothetical protein EZS28_012516 [Streblomastix strix]|uniref:Uncharacterized protein n=1 Tax=Streblomastix strix TaxID=222440 RepID=A0A5J4WAZ9_9EUKA|nr:MAG: hypothetical protein EZS28_012516 [Streblomastix strix]